MGGGAGRLPGRDVKRAGTFFVPSGKAGYRFAQPGSRLKRVGEFKKKPVKCWARQNSGKLESTQGKFIFLRRTTSMEINTRESN